MSTSGSTITLEEFRKLLNDKGFLDFFNKFICLPAFSQQVVYSRKRRQFVLYPPLPNYSILNCDGLIEWLWKKRLDLFLESRFYGEYRIRTDLIRHSLIKERGRALKTELAGAIHRSLRWLQTNCLGRVAGIRKFRRFMRNTIDGSQTYDYWMESERLTILTKRNSAASSEVLKLIKKKYLLATGERKISQNLLYQAWKNLRRIHRGHGFAGDAKLCGLPFIVSLQQICSNRIKNYWMPRFLLEQNPQVYNLMEAKSFKLAKDYLRGTTNLIPDELSSEPSDSEQIEKQDLEKEQYDDESISDEEDTSVSNFNEKFQQEVTADITLGKIKTKDTRRKRISFREQTSNDDLGSNEERKGESSAQSSSENKEEFESSMARRMESERKEPSEGMTQSLQSSSSRSENVAFQGEYKNFDDDNDSVNSTTSSEAKDRRESDGSDNAERNRKSKQAEKRFRLKDENRKRKLHSRKLKFEELLSKDPLKRPDLSSDQSKLSAKPKVKADSQSDQIEGKKFPLSKESQHHPSASEDTAGGKSLSKAVSKFLGKKKNKTSEISKSPKEHRESDRSSSQSQKEPPNPMEIAERLNQRRSELLHSESLSKSAPRKPDTTAKPQTATQAKRRKSTAKKPKRKKANTLTFSLCVEEPEEELPKLNKRNQRRKSQKSRKSDKSKVTVPMTLASSLYSLPIYTMDIDNLYRTQPENERMISALQADECASQPFRTFLVTTQYEDLIFELQFWQDVEKSRQDFEFGTMTFTNLVESMHSIAGQYLMDSSPCRIQAPDKLRTEAARYCLSSEIQKMPWQIRNLQREAMEELKYAHRSYCRQERQSFLIAAATKKENATTDGEFHLPSVISAMPSYEITYDVSHKLQIEMDSRRSRSLRYAIETSMPDGRDSNPMLEICDESDDDGCVPAPPACANVRDPPIDYKELASRSVKQYPDPNNPYGVNVRVKRPPDRRVRIARPFLIKKGGLIKRPSTRPKSFQDMLKDPVHFQFFKKYLQAHRADTPLTFWNAVENLRTVSRLKLKQVKARHIIKKYFHDTKIPAPRLLQCNADIIKELPFVDVITPPMLYTAQQVIGRAVLDEVWFKRYADTFEQRPSAIPDPEQCEKAPVARLLFSKNTRIVRKVWPILADFIRRAISFMRSMKKPHMFALFEKFLQKEASNGLPVKQKESVSPVEIFASGSASSVTAEGPFGKMRRGIINGQIITFDLLPSDLRFWRDILCFKNLLHGFSVQNSGEYSFDEKARIPRRKAYLIVSCYLNSNVPPNIMVNVPMEVADITVDSFQAGLIDQALFHEATVYVFPLLLHFWKKFCAEHYRYVPTISKKVKQIYGFKLTPHIAEQMRNKRLGISNTPEGGDSEANDKSKNKKFDCNKPVVLPNYLHLAGDRFVGGRSSAMHGNDDMGCRMTFSVRKGVTIIDSSSRRKTLLYHERDFRSPRWPARLKPLPRSSLLQERVSVAKQSIQENKPLHPTLRKCAIDSIYKSVR